MSGNDVNGNPLFMREIGEGWADWFKLIERQN